MSRLLAVLLTACATPLAASPVPEHLFPKAHLYYPTQVGAEWVYRDGGTTYTYFVAKVEEKDGVSRVSVNLRHRDGKGSQHSHTMEVSKGGLREVSNFNRKVEPPTPVLKVPGAKGDKWECPMALDGEKQCDYTLVAGGVEEVSVPAGKFNALRIDQTSVGTDGKTIQTIATWYAPGVGVVKMEYGGTRELVSFTPGKGAPAHK